MRNYRSTLGKWQTADPLGYADGWNALAYCGNGVTGAVDTYALWTIQIGCYFIGGAPGLLGDISAGFAFGFSWADGFSLGTYCFTGIGSELGAGGGCGFTATVSNCKNVSELAGQSISFGASTKWLANLGVDFTVPLDIEQSGYWQTSLSGGVAVDIVPAEAHDIFSYTEVATIDDYVNMVKYLWKVVVYE